MLTSNHTPMEYIQLVVNPNDLFGTGGSQEVKQEVEKPFISIDGISDNNAVVRSFIVLYYDLANEADPCQFLAMVDGIKDALFCAYTWGRDKDCLDIRLTLRVIDGGDEGIFNY